MKQSTLVTVLDTVDEYKESPDPLPEEVHKLAELVGLETVIRMTVARVKEGIKRRLTAKFA